MNEVKIGFGGGCHWCTEAVFQSLRGVSKVAQGFIKSVPPNDAFSEAVVVNFAPEIIPVGVLIDVHLRTHASTSLHKMRGKYRSAIYVYSDEQADRVLNYIRSVQNQFEDPIVTTTLRDVGFKSSPEQYQNYYKSNAEKPFCTTYIDPKLIRIREQFSEYVV